MTLPDYSLRPLTTDDLDALTRIHLVAFPESLFTALGREIVRRYYQYQFDNQKQFFPVGAFSPDEHLLGYCLGGVFRRAVSGFLRTNRAFLISQTLTRPFILLKPAVLGRTQIGLRLAFRRPVVHATKAPSHSTEKPFGIQTIAVHPDHQKHGIGRALLQYTERIAREEGFSKMQLTVHTHNQQAIYFYEREGWLRHPAGEDWQGYMYKLLSLPD